MKIFNIGEWSEFVNIILFLLDAFSGSSSDWSRGTVNIPYPYLVELRDSDGEYGFVAPPEEIIPCGAENWAGAKVILDDIIANYGGTTPP